MRRSLGAVMLAATLLVGCSSSPAAQAPSAATASAAEASAPTPAAPLLPTVTPVPTPTATPPPTVDELLASLADPTSAEIRAAAAESLARFQDPAVVPALASALSDSDVSVRIAVATSLGSLQDARAAKAVAGALQSELKAQPSSAFIPVACETLAQLGGRAGAVVLIAVLVGTDVTNRAAARAALTTIGSVAVPALQRALTTGTQAQKLEVVSFLASLGSLGVKPLITALTNTDAKVRSAAANRLGYLDNRSAEKPLANVLADSAMGLTASVALVRLFKTEPSKVVHYLTSTGTLRIYYGLMKLGATETVDAMASALLRLGDLKMAEDYLNCGEPTLEQAAHSWADANGYQVVTGYGSSDMSWGSGLPD
jgi:HEAT repeat protein